MNKIRSNIILVIAALVVLLGGGYYFVNQNNKEATKSSSSTTQEATEAVTFTVKADGAEKEYQAKNVVGKTALEATEAVVTIEKSGEGEMAFITSINGRLASDSKKEYWKFLVNSQEAKVGAGSYTIVTGDTIGWEIATY